MDPLRAAMAFVDTRFPDALAAIIGGSAATEHFSTTSDLDIVVLVDDSYDAFRETTEYDGWLVEAFCHTAQRRSRYSPSGRPRRGGHRCCTCAARA